MQPRGTCLLRGVVSVDAPQALSLLSEFQQTVHRPKSQYTGAAARKKQQVGRLYAMQRGLWQPARPRAC